MSGSALDGLLGRIALDGNSLDLGAGLNFTNGVRVDFNPTTGMYDVTATPRGVRSFALAVDTVLLADANGDVESTGASAVTVTVPTMPAGHTVVYAQQGTGALSFTASGVSIETAIATGGATTARYQVRTLFWRDTTHVRIS